MLWRRMPTEHKQARPKKPTEMQRGRNRRSHVRGQKAERYFAGLSGSPSFAKQYRVERFQHDHRIQLQ
ncbi:MAG: hypothetical protein ACJ8LM_16165, partial [Candidatus Udaeobacter sp.]